MSVGGPPRAGGAVALGRALAGAGDERLLRAVALLDALGGERGAADRLIEGARPRLAALRPPRPLRLCRLLFTPLDPVIVPPAAWRPGDGTLPRSAIAPLTAALRPALGPAGEAVERACEGRTTEEAALAARLGGLLWPLAAAALAGTPPPAGWAEAGLPEEAYPDLRDLCAAAWRAVGG